MFYSTTGLRLFTSCACMKMNALRFVNLTESQQLFITCELKVSNCLSQVNLKVNDCLSLVNWKSAIVYHLWTECQRLFITTVFACLFLDEKEKYDPSAFRDAVIQGLNETEADLDLVSTCTIHITLVGIEIVRNTIQ